MKQMVIFLGLSFLISALAWQPSPDLETAQRVVDGAYSRIPTVETSATVDLSVKDKNFAGGVGVKMLYGNPATCLAPWLENPEAYAQYGSRPRSVTVAGQADVISLEAQRVRNAFKNLSAQEALSRAQKILPAGHLRIFVEIWGLAKPTLRAAYTIGLGGLGNGFVMPYKSAYLDDWKPLDSDPGRYSGTMVYYFDLSKTSVDPKGTLNVVIKTEADTDCTYIVPVDLSKFE